MNIDVSTLRLAEPGTSLPFEIELPTVALDDVPATQAVRLSGTITKLVEPLLVQGEASLEVELTCGRCLETYLEKLKLEIHEEFTARPSDEQYPIIKDTIALAPMLRNLVLLALPLRPLHDRDCRGLCGVCGKNLDDEPHTHPKEPEAGPFDALKATTAPKANAKRSKSS